jgi:uncharacterized protein YlzI (FlbEa/FlbD family)
MVWIRVRIAIHPLMGEQSIGQAVDNVVNPECIERIGRLPRGSYIRMMSGDSISVEDEYDELCQLIAKVTKDS